MWPKLLGCNMGWIGCEITACDVKLAQVSKGAGHQSLLTTARQAVQVDLTGNIEPSCTEALMRALASATFRDRRKVVTCLQSQRTHYRHLRFAAMQESEWAPAVHWQIANEKRWMLNDFYSSYYDVGTVIENGKERVEVIAVSASRPDVENHERIIRSAGLHTLAIDSPAGALARCFIDAGPAGYSNSSLLVVSLNADCTTLIVVQQGMPTFIRQVDVGLTRVRCQTSAPQTHSTLYSAHTPSTSLSSGTAQAINTRVPLVEPECHELGMALVDEIALCLHYLIEARPTMAQPQFGCIVGSGLSESQLLDIFCANCELEFVSLAAILPQSTQRLLRNIPAGTSVDDWMLPLGLALYGYEHTLLGGG